jgi:predicted TIM-barrel fold metal-dependent hydrolase
MLSRRTFLGAAASSLARAAETVVDIHQHTHYSGRSDDDLVAHQRKMGITRTILLPAGSRFGLAADAWGNDSVVALAGRYPGEFAFFANELPDIAETRAVLEKYLKLGAIGIGEQKFPVDCDSPAIGLVASIAADYGVPVLMHFEHGNYNRSFERFHTVLARYPKVNFIGHAQTWWGNIDADHDQTVMYPRTTVTRGGLTDRYLRDYPNMFGDLSAGSGLNSMMRDEGHAREFLKRHQDKLLYGSDCNDRAGAGEGCLGANILAAIRRLAEPSVATKILSGNARRLMRLDRAV